ncbi:16S rRNA (cytosine(1402)-N(4))-methyltransferase [Lottiidibacillus patelloidae]|uniref:16S rRNA (Cytosine(1402)-N(4))-methyltransferase n=1 Tax=Lottiidibacillus patelloidae TaxID=2670334 RepID=A0A263BQZ8_9BACI|nr:class I SAM-dependent methyltransferase [Lottiidibacillus patelloidae]OZM56119.1 16S rRNA (cytosine(1402)-N(4))-methyltransferase [Lottiidibacillus patelloidae]
MLLERILPYTKTLLRQAVTEGDIVIDATVGNGNDTLFLTELVGNTGHVYGFDIQSEAIENTTKLLTENNVSARVTLFQESHDRFPNLLSNDHLLKVKAAIFNLGYLPKGDKSIVTKPDTTIRAVQQLLEYMPTGGLIILVVYHGHEGGKTEKDALLDYLKTIEQKRANVLQYQFINQVNDPPFIVALEKK